MQGAPCNGRPFILGVPPYPRGKYLEPPIAEKHARLRIDEAQLTTVKGQIQSDPMPNGASWRKVSPVLYTESTGRFRIEANRSTSPDKIADWDLVDQELNTRKPIQSFRAGKLRVTRILFEEQPGWED